MAGKPKESGWNVNINTKALNDPKLLNLSPKAFAALIWLQLSSANDSRDGFVPASAYTQMLPAYLGLPHVDNESLDELERAGLVTHRDESGLRVSWRWQTDIAAQREQWRDEKAAYRARKKEDGDVSGDVQKTS